MKRIFSLFLTIIMVIGIFISVPITSSAILSGSLNSSTGTLNSTISWEFSNNGVLTISGTGDIPDYNNTQYSPFYNKGNIKKVVINEGITSIGKHLFPSCDNLTSITIPDSVTKIGDGAFSWCSNLTSISIPNSVTGLTSDTFSACDGLTSINIDESNPNYSSIDGVLFNKSKSLLIRYPPAKLGSEYTIPNGVTTIAEDAFHYAINLLSVIIPSSVTSIGSNAFGQSTLKTIEIPDSVTNISFGAFSYSALESITLPNSITSISHGTFSWCRLLTSIIIPATVTSISSEAFYNCVSLSSVTIPDSVTSIGQEAFYGCESLTSITISNTVTSIGQEAFRACDNLSSVIIPKSVNTIGEDAFAGCPNLTIFGELGSYAETYANENSIPFEDIILFGSVNLYENSDIGIKFSVYNKSSVLEGDALGIASGSVNLRIKDAILTNNGNEYICSNGVKFVGYTDLSGKAVITKNGFYDYIIPDPVIYNFTTTKSGPLNVYLTEDRNDGKPYISTVFGRQHDDNCINIFKELQSNSLNILKDKSYDVIITADLKGDTSATYYLSQDTEHRISSKTGVFLQTELYSVFDMNKPIYAYAVTNSGRVTEPVTICMKKILVCDALTTLLSSETLNLLGSDYAKLTISDDVPVIGGAELSMNFIEFPIGVEVEGNRVRVSLGRDFFKYKKETNLITNTVEKEKEWISFKESCEKIEDKIAKDNGLAGAFEDYEKAKKEYSLPDTDEKIKSKSFNFGAEYLGYAEGHVKDDGTLVFTAFSGAIAAEFTAKYGRQLLIGVVPAYYSLQGGVEAKCTLELAKTIPDENIPFEFDTTLKVTPKIKARGGVGFDGIVCIGLVGSASLPIAYEFFDKHFTMSLTGKLGLEGEFIVWSVSKDDMLSGTVNIFDTYFGSSKKSLGGFSEAVYSEMAEVMYSDTPKVTYSLASRDYADLTSDWVGYSNETLGGMQAPVYSSGSASGVTVTELQTSVYKNSQTQLVQFGDKLMLAYIEDCAERDTYNRYRLMYTVYNPSTNEWTQPKAVCDSGKMDVAPSLATDGENVYIAWQTVNTTVTDSTEEALYDAMNNMEIYSAKYDESSDSFVDVVQHTSNTTYDYSPIVTVKNGSATVYWINADTLNYNAGEMSIHSSADTSNTVIYDNMNYITSLQASGNSVSYSMDVDGDFNTNDVKLFTDGVQVGEDVNEDTIITNFAYGDFNGSETLFYSDGGNVYYVADGKSEYAFSDNNGIASAIKITNLNGKPAVVYTQPTATGSELRVSTFENNAWSEPVFLTDTNSSISNVDVVSVNGKLYGVFNRTKTTEATDEAGETYLEYGQTDLCMLTSQGYYDLEISNIGYDEGNFSVGSSSPFIVVMENDGTEIINNVEFTVSDTLGYSKTVTKDVNLAPGAIESVELQYVAQEGYTACDLTVTANIVGENDINKDNNTTTEQIGRTDISVGTISVERIADVYKITCEVTNDSLIDAQNVKAKISFDIYKKNVTIGTIAAKSSYMVELLVAREELTFDENNICTLTFTASTSSEELVKGNNENTVTVENTEKLAEHEHSFVNNICDSCGMNAYSYMVTDEGAVITGYAGEDTEVSIPESINEVTVVAIGSTAFSGYKNLTSITIPDSITSIGDGAFSDCTNLTSVTISDNLKNLGASAFKNCTNITTVIIPDSVINIGDSAFYNCINLISINVDENNSYYSSVDGVLFNKDKTILIQYPANKLDTEYTIPDTVTIICDNAFYGASNLALITIPDSVTEIGAYAFRYCSNLAKINLPNSAVSIGKCAFAETGITELTLPENIVSLGNSAFSNCDNLYKITYNAINCTIGITNVLQAMMLHPFRNSNNIKDIVIGENVEVMPSQMFYGKNSISSVYITDIAKWCSIDFQDVNGNPLNFAENLYLNGMLVTKLVIPEGANTIGNYAFYNFKGFDSVTIHNSVTSIGNKAFYGCSALKYIFYTSSETNWNNITIGSDNRPLTNIPIHYNATDHTYEDKIDIEVTCTEDGLKHPECIVCGYSLDPEVIPTIGHNYSTEWSIDGVPTCTEEGSKSHHCTVCGDKTDITVIEATGHDYEVQSKKNIHPHTTTYKCSFCEDSKTETQYVSDCYECIYGKEPPIQETPDTKIDYTNLVIRTSVESTDEISDILGLTENAIVSVTPSHKHSVLELYGTGTGITVFDGNDYIGDFTLVVNGDTNGDSVCDALDAAQVALASNGHENLDGAYAMAADSNYDDIVDINDYQQIVNKAIS